MLSEIIIILFLILLNGILSMAEIALVSARKTRLDLDAQKGDKSAKLALDQANAPSKILSTIQIGITLIGILTGVYSGAVFAGVFATVLQQMGMEPGLSNTLSIVIVVTLITFLSLVFGELVPKQIGLANPEGISKFMVPVLLFLAFVTFPFTWLLTKTSDLIIKVLNIKPSSDSKVTEEEIKAMLQEGAEDGEVQEIEHDIVQRVFHLGDRKVSSLMTHHSDIVWLDVNESMEDIRQKIREDLHSVYPVCEDDLDNVKGVIFIKSLVLGNIWGDEFTLTAMMKPAQFVLETLTAYETLEIFKNNKIHYGLVVDEYGSTIGMITLNDILEALVGDFNEPSPDETGLVQRDDGSWLVDGQMPFFEFAYEFGIQGLDSSKIEFDTLAGLAISNLKRIPLPGEKFTWNGFEFEIVDLDGNRIDKLIIKRIEA
jgi:putative hemolysin